MEYPNVVIGSLKRTTPDPICGDVKVGELLPVSWPCSLLIIHWSLAGVPAQCTHHYILP